MNLYKFIMREASLCCSHFTGREFEAVTKTMKRKAESHFVTVHGAEVVGTAGAGPDSPSKAWLMTPVAAFLSSR